MPVLDTSAISGGHRMHPGYGMAVPDCLHLCRDGGALTAWNAELLNQIKRVPEAVPEAVQHTL